jgi:hypothetical protein
MTLKKGARCMNAVNRISVVPQILLHSSDLPKAEESSRETITLLNLSESSASRTSTHDTKRLSNHSK